MAASRIGFQERFAKFAACWAGSSTAFALAVGLILLWGATGPIFGYSDTWQLVINTSTTIITFLMVFLIQRSQNKDGLAIQLKLDELIAAVKGASNRLIDIEELSEAEVTELHKQFAKLARSAGRSAQPGCSLSIEAAMGEAATGEAATGEAAEVAHAAVDVQTAIRRHKQAIRKLRRKLAKPNQASPTESGSSRSRA